MDIFRTLESDGTAPGEISCTLMDAKIGEYIDRLGLEESTEEEDEE